MFNSSTDENVSVSEDHIGFNFDKEDEYINEDTFLPENETTDYCLVMIHVPKILNKNKILFRTM